MTSFHPRLIDDNDHDHRPPILSVIYERKNCEFISRGSKVAFSANSAWWAMEEHLREEHDEIIPASYSISIIRMDPKVVRR